MHIFLSFERILQVADDGAPFVLEAKPIHTNLARLGAIASPYSLLGYTVVEKLHRNRMRPDALLKLRHKSELRTRNHTLRLRRRPLAVRLRKLPERLVRFRVRRPFRNQKFLLKGASPFNAALSDGSISPVIFIR